MPLYPFPSRAFRRTRERASGLLLAFGVDDLSTVLTSGQTLALTRATGRTVFDSAGRVTTLVHSQWPWSAAYNDVEEEWEPILDIQSAGTNLCLQSENFGTTWAAVGTPTRTAAAKRCGDLALDLLGDGDSGALQGYTQPVTFTGVAAKAVAVFMAAGTSTSSVVRLRDTTAPADRLLGTVTWASGVPSVAMTTGVHINTIACANGAYRLLFQTASVTAANTNQIEVYPATNSSLVTTSTGTVYVGGVHVENALSPRAYIKTTTATVTHNVDAVTASVVIPLADFTVYVRVSRPPWGGLSGGVGEQLIIGPATTASNGRWWISYDSSNGRVNAGLMQAGSGQVSFQSLPSDGIIEVCAQFADITTAPRTRVDVGAGFSAYSSTVAAISQWDSTTTYLGSEGTGAIASGIRRALIASGARTMAQMQGLAV